MYNSVSCRYGIHKISYTRTQIKFAVWLIFWQYNLLTELEGSKLCRVTPLQKQRLLAPPESLGYTVPIAVIPLAKEGG